MTKKEKLNDFIDCVLRNHYGFIRKHSVKPIVYKNSEDRRIEIDVDYLYTISLIKITLLFDGLYIYDVLVDTRSATYDRLSSFISDTLSNMNTIIESFKIGQYIKPEVI